MTGPETRGSARTGLPRSPRCPFCEGGDTELMSPFGSQLSVATYWCNACRSPFELLKWRDRPAPTGTEPE